MAQSTRGRISAGKPTWLLQLPNGLFTPNGRCWHFIHRALDKDEDKGFFNEGLWFEKVGVE